MTTAFGKTYIFRIIPAAVTNKQIYEENQLFLTIVE